jgi:voltage-gated potassium channel
VSISHVRERIHNILEKSDDNNRLADVFNYFLTALIIANVFVVLLDTIESCHLAYAGFFYIFEVVSVIIFTVEYILRLWTCTVDPRYSGTVKGRFRYALSPLALVDLIAFLPFYLPMVLPVDLRILRLFRLFRLVRLLKLVRYSESVKTFVRVLDRTKDDIAIALFIGAIMLVVSSTIMYYAEHDAQPEKFASIPDTMWWGVITLTTIGYGDVYPVTPIGKIIGIFTAIIGVGMFALPAGILGSAFVEDMQNKKETRVCPHCGKKLDGHVTLEKELVVYTKK